jgi:hypothetical protein
MQDNTEFSDLSELLHFDEPARHRPRREDSRLLTIFRVGKLTTDRFEELCLVRNVGVGGLMARVHSPLVARQRVRVELRSDRKLWGNVLWIRDGTAGIGFDGHVDIDEMLARSDVRGDDRRSTGPRLNIECGARLNVDGRDHGVRVHDLGQCGVGVTSADTWENGQDVSVKLEGFRAIDGSVLWCRGGRIGIAFNKPIPFDEMTGWLQDKFGSTCVKTRRSAA